MEHGDGRNWGKWLALIPIVLLAYVAYANVKPFGGVDEFKSDVGGEDTTGTFRLTGPMDRVSEKRNEVGVDFRELKSSLVYFEYSGKMSKGAKIEVEARFRDNFTGGGALRIGAKNTANWSFEWRDLYNPTYEKLEERGKAAEFGDIKIYRPSGEEGYQKIGEWLMANVPEGSKIGTYRYKGENYWEVPVPDSGESKINTTIRGGHILYTYVGNGRLNIAVEKQDMNWYNGTDELGIIVYNNRGGLSGKKTIADDGIVGKSGERGYIQRENLYLDNLEEGVYRIELTGGIDLYIRNIVIDQPTLIFKNHVFVIEPARIYFSGGRVEFQTYHQDNTQQIRVGNETVDVNARMTWFGMEANETWIEIPKGDMIVRTDGYLAFTKEAYLKPKYRMTQDLEGADYIIANVSAGYTPVRREGEWLVASAEWDAKNLYFKDNKLQFVVSATHLGDKRYQNYTIPLDYVKITVKEPPKWIFKAD